MGKVRYIFCPKDIPFWVDGDGIEAYAKEVVEERGNVVLSAGWKKGVVYSDYYEVISEEKKGKGE